MGQLLLIILLIFGLILWGLYSFFSPVINVFRQAFGAGNGHGAERQEPFGAGQRQQKSRANQSPEEEQSTVDLIHETNMDLEGGEYVDYEEVRE